MACTNCTQTTASITGFVPADCTTVASCYLDAGCVYYTGPNLPCSSINTNDALDVILQKIDPLLCAATGDYSTYNTYCLAPITTQKQFVESISNFVCTLRDDFDTFTGTTFPAYQTATNNRLIALEVPGITCSSASVLSTDTLQQVLTKYCGKFGQIDTLLNISGANWSQCYVVSPAPTTPQQGFDTLIDQICLLKTTVEAGGAALPTFNNVGSCLPSPVTTTDTLVDTVNKIKTRLCQTGVLDTTTMNFGCVTGVVGAQNLQETLQNILAKVNQIAQALPTTWSPDFSVTNVDNGNLCLGKSIDLAPLLTTDRFVASNASDLSPGTLESKVTAGTNITLDFLTTPGQMIINSSGGSGTGDHKVMVSATDPSPDYLDVKILSGPQNSGLQVQPSIDAVNNVMLLNISVDPVALFQNLIDALSEDTTLYANFCAAVAQCPSPCDAPTNVIVSYSNTTTTSTTTTTTTTL